MNLLKELEVIFNKYNEENKCGFCWNFTGDLRSDYNNLMTAENCCVQICIDEGFTLRKNEYSQWIYDFTLIIGIPSELSNIMYKEVDGCNVCNSKWEKYIYPLINCFRDGFYDCNYRLDIVGNITHFINLYDVNLDGIKIRCQMTF